VDDGGAAVLSILERLRNWHSIVADIGGGLRAVVVSTLIALLMACKWAQVELHVSGEREDAAELRVQLNAVYNILTGIGQEKLRIVELLGLEGLDIGELSKALGKSERTVRAYAGELKRLGLVSEDKGKLFATSWGRVAINYQKT
jgi:CRISPR locus-related DNA-binding protein